MSVEASVTGLSVIIPAYNEAGAIGDTLDELATHLARLEMPWEVVVVDDASTDETAAVLSGRPDITLCRHPKNRGYGASLRTGIAATRYELCLFYDADGQFDPADIPALLAGAAEADMATGMRGKGSDAPLLRRPGKKILSWTANYLAKETIPDLNCGYRVVRRPVLERYQHLLPEGFSASTTLTLLLLKGGHGVNWVPVTIRRRQGSASTVSIFSDGFDTLLLIVRLITLLDPLRVFLPASGLMMSGAVLWGGIYFRKSGTISMATLFLLISAVLTFLIGLLADQVAALRRETHR